MPDYIYLLENRLSADQRHALRVLRDVAAEAGIILFLTGDAVRDLTSGHAVRDIEVSVHGNALKLKKPLEKVGAKIWGEDEASRTLYLCFPGTVRVDLVSTHRVEYPKPAKPVYHPASIQEDLRRRDFTANAMAISLNEGSYGLLMDPLNGAADIETRTLRLVSNYGFLENPVLLIRATRYKARLGWELDSRTQTRFDNAREEGVIDLISAHDRGAELEQIGHEEEGLKVLEALEFAGWMKVLDPAWTVARADVEGLKALHDQAVELLMQGIHPDMSAAQMELLTAKMSPKDLSALKKMLIRPGFVEEWNSLNSLATGFQKALLAKDNQKPSMAFKLFMSYDPEAVLWLEFTTKDAGVRERYNLFLKVWPEARQRIPYALMQEMRITPELATYNQIVEAIFLELIDGKLTTPEETRTFLEPHSPPAPPPQITIKRTRAKRGAGPKMREASFEDEEESEEGDEQDLDDIGGDDEEEIDMGLPIPKGELGGESDEAEEEAEGEEEAREADEEEPVAPRRGSKADAAARPVKLTGPSMSGKTRPDSKAEAPAKAASAAKPAAPAKGSAKPEPAVKPKVESAAKVKPAAPAPAKAMPAPAKAKPAPAVSSKGSVAKLAAKAAPVKSPAKTPPVKTPSKPAAKPAPKSTKPVATKPAAKKPVPKPAQKSAPKSAKKR